MEVTLRRHQAGRLVLRESDGLIPICDDCFSQLLVESPRSVWPLGALGAAVLLFVRGNWLIGLAATAIGLVGGARALRRPTQRTAHRRLRAQVLVFSSVPMEGFAEQDVSEVVLERRLSVRFKDDGTSEASTP